jgi:hydrogenase nickel incorporation protein HypB
MAQLSVPVVERVLSANDRLAEQNRERLDAAAVFALNVMASPGAGKTSLILRTIEALAGRLRIGVVEGDTAPVTIDAERIAAKGIPAVQVNTAGGCHLDAGQLGNALGQLALQDLVLLIVENVGNLVCPASWDLGETAKIVVFSVTEGEDKPLKYPKMFRMARYAVLNKVDLLPHLDFDVDKAIACAREVNPELRFFLTSARTGQGLDTWYDFLRQQVRSPASL